MPVQALIIVKNTSKSKEDGVDASNLNTKKDDDDEENTDKPSVVINHISPKKEAENAKKVRWQKLIPSLVKIL